MRVLIVDDEPIARSSLKALFESASMEAVCAENASGAMELAEQQTIDAAVVDWMLRDELDGLDIAAKLKDLSPTLRLILMTGYPLEDLIRRRRDCGFDFEVLTKPFSFESLLDLVRDD